MKFVYLDEFGHIGPFVSRTSARYSESPIFGLAGVILPQESVRPFATKFLQLKEFLFSREITASGKMAQKWEKKGNDIFRPKAVKLYPNLRMGGFRLIKHVDDLGGKLFYYGREKMVGKLDGNSTGLYTTILSHVIRKLDRLCTEADDNFVLIMDQHATRKELLECAAKTMHGAQPARRLLSPPFEVESYLDQNMQAADWIAAIVGRLWAYELQPDQYKDHQQFRRYYWDRVHTVATYSSVERRRPPRAPKRPRLSASESALSAALEKAGIAVPAKSTS
jgi:uncharacterized protein DUF3800